MNAHHVPAVPSSKALQSPAHRSAPAQRPKAPRAGLLARLILAAMVAPALVGCRTLDSPEALTTLDPVGLHKRVAPSNHRNWKPHLAVLPRAELQGRRLMIRNIRNFKYVTEDEYILDYYDGLYDLDRLRSLDFIVVPFADMPSLAHTMLSFGFDDGRYLAISVEVRLEEGESYSPIGGALRQYEVMYVVADERDLIKLRTQHRQADVYIYRTTATADQSRFLLVDIMQRVNKLTAQPEFYDTFTNNCTTNIVRHINHLHPGKVPYDYRILFPGYSDQLAYDLGLLVSHGSFEQTKRLAKVNDLANLYRNRREFSQLIRR